MNHGPTMHAPSMPHSAYGADSHSHVSGHMPHSSVSSAASAPSYYSSGYATHQGMPSGLPSYSSGMSIPQYNSYASGGMAPMTPVSSGGPMPGQMMHQSPGTLPSLATTTGPSSSVANSQGERPMDTTGQIAPPGVKPRVTATLWEDEGSLCFQVEAGGICVARREDNHMINGTKLLNVAGMTRGRRDGILKSEKTRHVVKIGPMHLKGVWIPFERALEFANKEKITEQLYPLFVHQIGQLLYHPPGAGGRTGISTAMATTDRTRTSMDSEGDHLRSTYGSQAPSLQHHHSMSGSISGQGGQGGHASSHSAARPGLDRAHTFAAPGSNMGMSDSSGYSSHWQNGPTTSGPMSAPLHVDTGINGTRSVPSTPANPVSSPPTNGLASVSSYQTSGAYEPPRSYHSAHPSYSSGYGGSVSRYSAMQSSPATKTEMGPPARVGHDGEDKYNSHGHEQPPSSEAGETDHDNDYTHSAGPYSQHRGNYAYGGQTQTPISAESQDMSGSPHKQPGRSTPRTTGNYPPYGAPQRPDLPASNLYTAIGNDPRSMPNGSGMYSSNNYSSQSYASPTSLPPSNKRGHEIDDDEQNFKRQRMNTHEEASRQMVSQKKR
ncbi:putative cell pattern formation-associated protein stuA [Elsinoe fawcettii]|nr:putative cell pattern formation-associated protein stuA [Elsinoe fawcettii]